MRIEISKLEDWVNQLAIDINCSPFKAKEITANELNVGIATIYRWIKEGLFYVQEVYSGDEISGIKVFKLEKEAEFEAVSNDN